MLHLTLVLHQVKAVCRCGMRELYIRSAAGEQSIEQLQAAQLGTDNAVSKQQHHWRITPARPEKREHPTGM
jgi:hypothetical protein